MTNVTLIGRLTADPKTGKTANGNVFANFAVADVVNDNTVYFHNCVAFGKVAEIIEMYAKKGTQVAIVGLLTNREYTDSKGIKRKTTEILVNSVKLLGSAEKAVLTPVEPVKKTYGEQTRVEVPEDDCFPF